MTVCTHRRGHPCLGGYDRQCRRCGGQQDVLQRYVDGCPLTRPPVAGISQRHSVMQAMRRRANLCSLTASRCTSPLNMAERSTDMGGGNQWGPARGGRAQREARAEGFLALQVGSLTDESDHLRHRLRGGITGSSSGSGEAAYQPGGIRAYDGRPCCFYAKLLR